MSSEAATRGALEAQVCNFIKTRLQQVFSCEYCDIFKSTYFEEHLRKAASVFYNTFFILRSRLSFVFNTFFYFTSISFFLITDIIKTFKVYLLVILLKLSLEAYLEPCQTSMLESFAKMVNSC